MHSPHMFWAAILHNHRRNESSCQLGDEVVLYFRVFGENLQRLTLQFRIASYSRKETSSEFWILLKLPKDVPGRGCAFEWNNRKMIQQFEGLRQ
jgi:hypothetical protein